MRARVKIKPRQKRRHARSRFARSTIPEEKWGTIRSLRKPVLARKKEGASGESAFTIFILSYEKH